MSSILQQISQVLSDDDLEHFDQNDEHYLDYVKKHLLYGNEDHIHIPAPIYSYIRPTMGIKFFSNVMISMERFETDNDLTFQPSIIE